MLTAAKASIVAEFPTVFEDASFRSTTRPPMHITLQSDTVPCSTYWAHTIPFLWRTTVKAQLAFMVTKGVIITEWRTRRIRIQSVNVSRNPEHTNWEGMLAVGFACERFEEHIYGRDETNI